jgi:hypothetical protein
VPRFVDALAGSLENQGDWLDRSIYIRRLYWGSGERE